MQKARHILDLNAEERTNFINSFDIVLSDCDGVVWLVSGAIPRTGEAINLLKAAGKTVKFVSNNSERSDEEYLKKFKTIGVADVVEVGRCTLAICIENV